MVEEFIEKWEKYKGDLEDYFRNTKQEEYNEYSIIVKKIIELIINRDIEYGEYNYEKLLVIDDGDYQGTQIFIAHKSTYQPSVEEYIYTSNYYGSCSGCDTLQSISMYCCDLPTEQQIKDYMMLALHLIQNFRKMEENNE